MLSINNNTKVITTENNAIKRSTKIINPVLEFCLKNKINFEIFNHNKTYSDMQNALVCSFGVIFSEKFIKENKRCNPLKEEYCKKGLVCDINNDPGICVNKDQLERYQNIQISMRKSKK